MAKRFSSELSTVVFAEKSFTSSPLTIEELRLNRNFLISDEANAQLRALEFFATLVSSGDLPLNAGLSNMGTGKHCWDCLSTPKLSLKMIPPVLPFLWELLSWRMEIRLYYPDSNLLYSLIIQVNYTKVLAEEDVYLRIVEFLLKFGTLWKGTKTTLFGLKWLLKLILKEACWIIGNLVGGTTCHLQAVIDEGFIPILIDLMKNKFDIRYEAAWAVYSVSCGSFKQTRRPPSNDIVPCLVIFLSKIGVKHQLQISHVLHLLWKLLSVADGDKPDEGAILSGLQLVIFLDHSSELYKVLAEEDVYDPKYSQLALYALMVIGNLAPCGKAQKQLSLALSGYLSKLILKEAGWIIGNLVGGTTCLLQTVIDEGLSLFDLMKNKFDIRYEAAWAVYSVSCGSFKQIRYLLHIEVIECVKGLCNLLSFTSDPKLLDVCLNGLNNFLIQGNMLRKKSTANVYAKTIKND
ncbi:unnamed protein product [Vicia faba]|uniref:Uncharacterized protein n=1 Tax=Vicia faba TaxID=3906 RepID=A0AAV0YPD4_VICFA|nr:unnamed protein product [Vicia faba]